MNPFRVFEQRFRGFRVVEIGGVGILLVLALVVYLAKTHAGGQRDDIDRIQEQITDEQGRVSLLRAEVAKLEQPERLAALSGRFLNLQPIPAAHEIDPQALAAIARGPAPQQTAQAQAATPTVSPLAANAANHAQPAAAAMAPPRADDATPPPTDNTAQTPGSPPVSDKVQ